VNYDTETGEVFDATDGATIEHVADSAPLASGAAVATAGVSSISDVPDDFLPPAAPSKLTEKMKAAL
jgi:hypothetical protein